MLYKWRTTGFVWWWVVPFFGLYACTRSDMAGPAVEFDVPRIIYPDDNQPSAERTGLGRRLFYDPVLSVDSSISCGHCHRPELAFTDGLDRSRGVLDRTGDRNSPSLANVAFQPYLMREGGVPTLEMQVLVPIQEHAEFDHNILLIADKLGRDSSYRSQSIAAYGREPDPFVITRAIAAFQRSLLSFQARFDAYVTKRDPHALSKLELRGLSLFYSDSLACGGCHSGILLTDFSFRNNGLYTDYPDPGKARLTGRQEDIGVFKVPSLRNLSYTAPYMHDGSLTTLEAVLDHYASGGREHPNRDGLIRGFSLSRGDKAALLAFLRTLDDTAFVSNPDHRPQ